MIDPAYESMLERYRDAWESGQFDRLIPAFMLCAHAELPMPEWLREAVLDELDFSYRTRQRGGPSSRTGAIQDHQNRVNRTRHLMVRAALDQQAWDIERGRRNGGINKREAARTVGRMLTQFMNPARGSTDAILESYNSLEKSGK